MPVVKFFGILQEKYGEEKRIIFNGKLKELLEILLDEIDLFNEFLTVLINGRYTKDKEVLVVDSDVITLYIMGGKGYPGG